MLRRKRKDGEGPHFSLCSVAWADKSRDYLPVSSSSNALTNGQARLTRSASGMAFFFSVRDQSILCSKAFDLQKRMKLQIEVRLP